MIDRRTNLSDAWRPHIHAGDEGEESPRICVTGTTKNGVRHEVVIKMSDWHLKCLVDEIRSHFIKRQEREESHARWRMEAFKGGQS